MDKPQNQNSLFLDQSALNILNNSASMFQAKEFKTLKEQIQDLTIKKIQLEAIAELFSDYLKSLIENKAMSNFNVKENFEVSLKSRVEEFKLKIQSSDDPNISNTCNFELILEEKVGNFYFDELQQNIDSISRMLLKNEVTLASEIDEEIKTKLRDMSKAAEHSKNGNEEQRTYVNMSHNTLEKLNILHTTDEYNERLKRIENSMKQIASRSPKLRGSILYQDKFVFEEDKQVDLELKESEDKLRKLKILLKSDDEGQFPSNRSIERDKGTDKNSDEGRIKRAFNLVEDLQKSVTRTVDNLRSTREEKKNNAFNGKVMMDIYEEIKKLRKNFDQKLNKSLLANQQLLNTEDVQRKLFNSKSPDFQQSSPRFAYQNKEKNSSSQMYKAVEKNEKQYNQNINIKEIISLAIKEYKKAEESPHTTPFDVVEPKEEDEAFITSDILEDTINRCLHKFEKNILSAKYLKSDRYFEDKEISKEVTVIRDWLLQKLVKQKKSEDSDSEENTDALNIENSFKNELVWRLNNLFHGLVGTDVKFLKYLTKNSKCCVQAIRKMWLITREKL